MTRCPKCFNLSKYCTCEGSAIVNSGSKTKLFLPESFTPADPELHTGFYL